MRSPHNKTKRQPMDWEKTFANNATNKGLTSKINKQLIQLNIKERAQLKNGQKGASLVVQWLRIHLPMQGIRVQALV